MADPETFSGIYGFEPFNVFFYGNRVYIGKTEYPLGQSVVDVMNLDDACLFKLDRRMLDFVREVQHTLEEDTDGSVQKAQEKLAFALELVAVLPVYRDLDIDWEASHHIIQVVRSDEKLWRKIKAPETKDRSDFEEMICRSIMIGEQVRLFRKQVALMLEGYFEPLSRRNADAYAEGYFKFSCDMVDLSDRDHGGDIDQSFPVEVSFVPMLAPSGSGKIILAEEAHFSELLDFLEVEFYRGLAVGNAPRRCHNCGRYFLLTAGYNTCYCNNIAPGETERTCRKVGAHRKEAQGRANRTPAKVEYDKAYLRLKQRKLRGKISVDEWNTAVAKAQELLEQSEQGKLTDEELAQKLKEL